MSRSDFLTKSLTTPTSLAQKAALVLAGSLVIAIAAQISVPMFPVPMTLQTLAILTVAFALGARLGVAALVAYLVEGAMGLPVFANGGAGLAYMFGPTGGFLLGFVVMAYIAGLAADRGMARNPILGFAAALVASAALYVPGLAWPALVMGVEPSTLLSGWMAPFIAGDVVKALLAALIVAGAFNLRKAVR